MNCRMTMMPSPKMVRKNPKNKWLVSQNNKRAEKFARFCVKRRGGSIQIAIFSRFPAYDVSI